MQLSCVGTEYFMGTPDAGHGVHIYCEKQLVFLGSVLHFQYKCHGLDSSLKIYNLTSI